MSRALHQVGGAEAAAAAERTLNWVCVTSAQNPEGKTHEKPTAETIASKQKQTRPRGCDVIASGRHVVIEKGLRASKMFVVFTHYPN